MWKDLTDSQKAAIIRMSVKQGVTDLDEIKSFYDKTLSVKQYGEGGKMPKDSNAMWNRAIPMYNTFIQSGFTPMQAVGILGNIAQESSFNPKASNGTHWGYLQNEKALHEHLLKYYGGDSHQQQMQFIIDGMQGRLRGNKTSVGKMLQHRFDSYVRDVAKATSPEEAASLWEKHYEKSGGQDLNKRHHYARDFYDKINPHLPDNMPSVRRKNVDYHPYQEQQELPAQIRHKVKSNSERLADIIDVKGMDLSKYLFDNQSPQTTLPDSFFDYRTYEDGGILADWAKRPSYKEWVKTVPEDRKGNNYNLEKAYYLADPKELESWRTSSVEDLVSGKNHLNSSYYNPNTGVYEFMKGRNHPTLFMEYNWYASPDAKNFRKDYDYVNSKPSKYVPKPGKWFNTYATGGDIFLDYKDGDKANTVHCAKFGNGIVNDLGYLISGDAWHPNDVDLVYSGYDKDSRPAKYDRKALEDYNHSASDNMYNNFDSKNLDPDRLYTVNMYYDGSKKLKDAYNNGKGVTGTHMGVLHNEKGKWWVTHNIDGTIHKDGFIGLQSGKRKYGVTAVFAPRLNTGINKAKGKGERLAYGIMEGLGFNPYWW